MSFHLKYDDHGSRHKNKNNASQRFSRHREDFFEKWQLRNLSKTSFLGWQPTSVLIPLLVFSDRARRMFFRFKGHSSSRGWSRRRHSHRVIRRKWWPIYIYGWWHDQKKSLHSSRISARQKRVWNLSFRPKLDNSYICVGLDGLYCYMFMNLFALQYIVEHPMHINFRMAGWSVEFMPMSFTLNFDILG